MTLLTAGLNRDWLLKECSGVGGIVNRWDVMVFDGWPFDLILSDTIVAAAQHGASLPHLPHAYYPRPDLS